MLKRARLPVCFLAFALCGACGSGREAATPSETAATTASEAPVHSGAMTFAFGAPGDPMHASRTIKVTALDTNRFDPASVAVKPGETVTFDIVNAGKTEHEFVLGDQATQDADEAKMREGHTEMHDPNTVTVPAGAGRKLTWTFPTAATTLIYGCHVEGHYKAGQRGTISVKA